MPEPDNAAERDLQRIRDLHAIASEHDGTLVFTEVDGDGNMLSWMLHLTPPGDKVFSTHQMTLTLQPTGGDPITFAVPEFAVDYIRQKLGFYIGSDSAPV